MKKPPNEVSFMFNETSQEFTNNPNKYPHKCVLN